MRLAVSGSAFMITLGVGIAFVLLSVNQEFTNATVEIIGAFLGVFAAIELGELIKGVDQMLGARKVKKESVDFLKVVRSTQQQGVLANLDITLWDTLRYSPEFSCLSTAERMSLHSVFGAIAIYNEQCNAYFSRLRQPNANLQMLQTEERAALAAQTFMLRLAEDTIVDLG